MTPVQLIERLQKLPVDLRIEETGTVCQVEDDEWQALDIVLMFSERVELRSLEAALTRLRAFNSRTGIPARAVPEMWWAGRLSICRGMLLTMTEEADGSWAQLG